MNELSIYLTMGVIFLWVLSYADRKSEAEGRKSFLKLLWTRGNITITIVLILVALTWPLWLLLGFLKHFKEKK